MECHETVYIFVTILIIWQESTHEEIRKRLDVMGDMWQKGQLSLEVQKRMLALSEGTFTVLFLACLVVCKILAKLFIFSLVM